MDYKTKYEQLMKLAISLSMPECSQKELDNNQDFVDDYDSSKSTESNLWDGMDVQDKLTASMVRTNLKENLNLDINNLSVDEALELFQINPNIRKILKCIKVSEDDTDTQVLEKLNAKKNLLNKIKE